MTSTNIQTAIKVRPLIEREKKEKLEPMWLVKENSIVQTDSASNFIGEPYSFDHIFDCTKSNKDVYDAIVKPLVQSSLEGINCTIFAYGQTSSGKTHTMLGARDVPGIISYTVQDIFRYIDENTSRNYLLRCSCLEIYNEKINDLLNTKNKDMKIREDLQNGVYVSAKEEVIQEPDELIRLLKKGMSTRKIGCTDMNERSSRSHTIFKIIIQSHDINSEGSYTESILSLVDLAGSERVGQMKMDRERQVEGVSINKSLTTLGLVIRKLSENEQFINYRDSKLTRLLQDSLGGNSKTLIIAAITVAVAEETKSTLEFAQRAKYVKNSPIINERTTDKDQLKQYEHLCEDYKTQLEKLLSENLEREKTINELQCKISNVKLFSENIFEKTTKPLVLRRHTMAHFNEIRKHTVQNSESLDICLPESIPSETHNITTYFSNDSDDDFEDSLSIASEMKCPQTPVSHLRKRIQLLEESFTALQDFTTLESQCQDGSYNDEVKELIERLRLEILNLQREVIDLKKNPLISCDFDDVKDGLQQLYNILQSDYRRSLPSIVEEEIELSDLELDSIVEEKTDTSFCLRDDSVVMVNELKQELDDKNRKIKLLLENIDESSEKNLLLEQRIQSLEGDIKQSEISREAELDCLNDKIKRLTSYKMRLHDKLSEMKIFLQFDSTEESFSVREDQNKQLYQEMEALKPDFESEKSRSVDKSLEITKLQEENQLLMLQLEDVMQEKKNLVTAVDDLKFELDGEREELAKFVNMNEDNKKLILELERAMSELGQPNDLLKQQIRQFVYSEEKQNDDSKNVENKREITEQCEMLKKQLDCANKELMDTKEQLQEQLKSKDIILEENTHQSGWLKQQLDRANKELEDTKAKQKEELRNLENKVEDMIQQCEQLRELEDTKKELQEQLRSKDMILKEISQESELLKEQLDCANKELEDSKAKQEEEMRSLGNKEEDMCRLLKELEDMKKELQEELRSKDIILKEISEESELIKEQLDFANKELEDTKAKQEEELRSLGNKEEDMCKLLKQLEDMKKELQEELRSKDIVLKEISEESELFKEQLDFANKELEDTKAKQEEELRSLENKVQDMTQQCKLLKELEDMKEDWQEKLRSKDIILKEISQESELLKEQLDCANKELENTKAKQKEELRSLENKAEDMIVTRQQIDIQDMVDSNKILEATSNELDISQNEDESSGDILESLTMEHKQLKEIHNNAISDYSIKIDFLEKKKSDLLLLISENEELNRSLENECEALKEKCSDYERQVNLLEQEVKELGSTKEINQKLEQEISNLNRVCSSLESELVVIGQELDKKGEMYDLLLWDNSRKVEEINRLLQENNGSNSLANERNKTDSKSSHDNSKLISEEKQLGPFTADYIDKLADELNTDFYKKLKLEKECQDIRDEIERLQSLEKIRNGSPKTDYGSSNLTKELQIREQELMAVQHEFEKIKSEYQDLCEEMQDLKLENQTLNSREMILIDHNIKHVTKIQEIKLEQLKLENNHDKLLNLNSKLFQEIKNMKDEKSELSKAMEELSQKNKVLQKKKEELINANRNLLEDVEIKERELQASNEKSISLNQRIEFIQSNGDKIIETFKSREKELMSKLQRVEEDFALKDKSLIDIEYLIKTKTESNTALTKRFMSCKSNYEHIIALLEELESCQSEVGYTKEKLNKMTSQVKFLESKLLNIHHKNPTPEVLKENIPIQCQSEGTNAEVMNLRKQLDEKTSFCNELIEKMKCLQESGGDEDSIAARSRILHLKEIRIKYASVKKRYEETDLRLHICKKEMAVKNEELDTLKAKHLKTERIIKNLESSLQNTQSNVDKLVHELSAEKKNLRQCLADKKELELANEVLRSIKSNMRKSDESQKADINVLQEKTRLSDETRPVSSIEARKMKRRSIQDQRRPLSESDSDCKTCENLDRILMENTKKIEKLELENEKLNRKIQELESKQSELPEKRVVSKVCRICDDLKQKVLEKVKISECQQEKIKTLKEENEHMDKENDEMKRIIDDLEADIEKHYVRSDESKKIIESLEAKLQFHDSQSSLYRVSENEVKFLKEEVSRNRAKIAALEKTNQELIKEREEDHKSKEEFAKKYHDLRNIVRLRRLEGNYLRSKLNLPKDCPVLPEDTDQVPEGLI